MTFSERYRSPLKRACWLQALLALLAATVMDMGENGTVILIASAAFWAGVLIVMLRRPVAPSRLDLAVVAYGLLIALGIAAGMIAAI